MSKIEWPWPMLEKKKGHSFVTIEGVRYRMEGTGHSYETMKRKIKNGEATEISKGETE